MTKPSPDQNIVILGVDPGTQVTGFGLIQTGPQFKALDYGCIRPPSKLPLSERYLIIFQSLDHLIDKYKPDAIAVESQFVHKNVQSAMKLGMARGMVILAGARKKIPLFEYAPKKAKLAVVGTGSASKHQVQNMVQMLLKLPSLPQPEDAADALALAICHAHQNTFQTSLTASRL